MATITVDDTLLNSPHAEDYFVNADRRVMIGLRAALEILGIPRPVYAERRKPGRTPARDIATAHALDNGKTAKQLHFEKAEAANKIKYAQAATKLAEARGLPGSMFAQTFGS